MCTTEVLGDMGLVVDDIINPRRATNEAKMREEGEGCMARENRIGSVVLTGVGLWMAMASAFSLVHEWWGKRFAESLCVWTVTMTHPVTRMLRTNRMFPQVTFLLVFFLVSTFRGLAWVLE
jgi:hypothetical protein